MYDLANAAISYRDPRGYVRLTMRGHPLARANGTVPRHRAVLYESLGHPRYSACHWCGYILPWRSDEKSSRGKVVINVDHLNETPGDDRPENLVPSCFWCNVNRGWMQQIAPGLWQKVRRAYRSTHPSKRPHPRVFIAFACGVDELTGLAEREDQRTPTHPETPDSERYLSSENRCLEAVVKLLERISPAELSTNGVVKALRSGGLSFRNSTIADALRLAAADGRLTTQPGPRAANMHRFVHPSEHQSSEEEPQVRATATLVEQFFTAEDIRRTRQHEQNP